MNTSPTESVAVSSSWHSRTSAFSFGYFHIYSMPSFFKYWYVTYILYHITYFDKWQQNHKTNPTVSTLRPAEMCFSLHTILTSAKSCIIIPETNTSPEAEHRSVQLPDQVSEWARVIVCAIAGVLFFYSEVSGVILKRLMCKWSIFCKNGCFSDKLYIGTAAGYGVKFIVLPEYWYKTPI